ncbi:MAG: CHAT domain-containing protein [Cyanobacteriota bacterium]|nr:CHAT domain-containing protein [Cyanobacteriota bacterium]
MLVILDLDGDLKQETTATLEIRAEGELRALVQTRVKGKLPPCPDLLELYQKWQKLYYRLGILFRLEERFYGNEGDFSGDPLDACRQAARDLVRRFNDWLKAESFRPIREKILEKISDRGTARIILQVESIFIRKLPWHLWDLIQRYSQVELAIGSSVYELPVRRKVERERARILAIFGHHAGIDISRDRALFSKLRDRVEIEFLTEPNRQDLDRAIWDDKGWDILFFAGHSTTFEQDNCGRLELNARESLSLNELTYALKKSVENGLKIAIFNSCDGLGLARQLERLNIPQTIVMREPIPDAVAQAFLTHFLDAFSKGNSLYLSVRTAREKLQSLEDRFPCATWLPVLCQNPTELPVTWQELVDLSRETKPYLTQEIESQQLKVCPYRGLAAFSPEDAPFFFGRERFVEKLIEAVKKHPFVAAIGPSGSGKSSLICAGLIPRLKTWIIASFRPGNNPYFQLAESLIAQLEPDLRETDRLIEINKLVLAWQNKEITLGQIIDRLRHKHPQKTPFLLVADQFEELYTLCEPKIPFLDFLLEAVEKTEKFTLVLTLRADFLEKALTHRPFAEKLGQYNPLLLGPMNRQELHDAIAKPALQLNIGIADGLTQRILDALHREPGQLPLLEFALTLLWERQENGWLTHQAYDSIGGVERALVDYAEQTYAQLNPQHQQQAQRILTQLVRPGEGTADTRRRATCEELGLQLQDVLQHLINARLLICDSSGTVELVHEALLQTWQRLRQWVEADRAFRTWQDRSRAAMNQWEKNNGEEGLLLRGTPLLEAQTWLEKRGNDLGDRETRYIQTSLALDRRERQVRVNLRKTAAIALFAAVFGSLSLGGLAAWQWQRAQFSELGSAVKTLLASSEELFASKKEIDALLESLRAAQQLRSARDTDAETRARTVAALHQAVYGIREYNRLESHQATVSTVAWSPDGQYFLSGSDDDTIKLWQRNGRELASLEAHRDRIRSVAWNSDSRTFASVGDDGTMKLWQLEAGKQPVVTQTLTLEGQVNQIQFSADGKILAAVDTDGKVTLWQVRSLDLKPLRSWMAHQSWATGVSFSPGSPILATASSDRTIKVWNLDGSLRKTLSSHQGTVHRIAFNPQGELVSASSDRTAKVWDANGTLMVTLKGHRDRVWDAAWSPDGKTLATASRDGTLKLWQRDGTLIATLEGHNASIYNVGWSPDGQTLATGSADTTVKFWHPFPKAQTVFADAGAGLRDLAFIPASEASQPPILAIANAKGKVRLWDFVGSQGGKTLETGSGNLWKIRLSPDGFFLAAASADGFVRLFPARSVSDTKNLSSSSAPRATGEIRNFENNPQKLPFGFDSETGDAIAASAVAFSPDGGEMALLRSDSAIELRSQAGEIVQTLREPHFEIMDVKFSPDGKMLAAIGKDETVKIWQRGTYGMFQVAATLSGHTSDVWDIAWSPDSQTLASASLDGTIKLWQRNRRGNFQLRPTHTLKGHLNRVNSVAFRPNGQILASGSSDGTVKLWSRKGKPLKTFKGDRRSISAVAWSPDGRYLAAASDNRTASVWDFDLDRLFVRGCLWIEDYLQANPNLSDRDRLLCDGV